ncbi:MAG: 3-dehydroquinate synthase [Verrucomicrobiales bacterium]
MTNADFDITVSFRHRIRFTRDVFSPDNETLRALLEAPNSPKVLVFYEKELATHFPSLEGDITAYLDTLPNVRLTAIEAFPGAETCKRDDRVYQAAMAAVEREHIDRHSYLFAIGGGAFLDVIGYAAATAHRGVRLVRFPTTTLSQDDSGVGVKNGINAFGKKNFTGAFAVPYAVVNDFAFLETQPENVRREGLIEAVKVALVRDGEFFSWLESNAGKLRELDQATLEKTVARSALLHARHIAEGGDPFETGSSRPLDYGHWSAHKMEQLSDFALSHGEAVSIGVALDSLYAAKIGLLSPEKAERILRTIETIGLPLWHEVAELRDARGRRRVFNGLEEFREHLGGQLTVLLLKDLGTGIDAHEMDEKLLDECFDELKERALVS